MSLIPLILGALGFVSVVLSGRLLVKTPPADLLASAAVLILPTFAVLSEAGPARGTMVQLGVGGAVVGLTAISLARDDSPATVTSTGFLAFLLAVVMVSVNVLEVPDISVARAFGRFAPAFIWLLLALQSARTRTPSLVASNSLAFAFGLACMLTAFAPAPWRECTQFKCGPFGALLGGPFTSENYFAQIAAVALLISIGMRHSHAALASCGALSAMIVLYASSSRTSQIALGVALISWYLWSRRSVRFLSAKPLVAAVLPLSTVILGIVLVYRATPTDYSNRGYIWTLGRTALADRWWSGLGIDSWTPTVLQRNFMHSQALLLLYSAGVLGVLVYALVMRAVIQRLVDTRDGLGFAVVVLALILGLTEIVWNPVALDGSAFIATAILMAGRLTTAATDNRQASLAGGLNATTLDHSRVTRRHGVRRDVRRDHRSSPNDRPSPHGHSG